MRVAGERIHEDGGVCSALVDNRILFWNSNWQFREIVLNHFTNEWTESDFAISGSTLIVSSPHLTGNPGPSLDFVQEYTLTWIGGLPSGAVYVTNLTYSTVDGRGARCIRTAMGGLIAATTRHTQEVENDLCYRSPAGKWSFNSTTNISSSWASTGLELFQGNDGRVYVIANKDGSGEITLTRFVEHNGGLAYVDFDREFIGADSPFAPDVEFPWIQLSGTNLSYQSVIDSKYGCWWRVAHPCIVNINIKPVIAPPRILSHAVSYQNIYLTWQAVAGQLYEPQVSDDLTHWLKMETYSWVESPGQISVSGVNPFYTWSTPPFTNLFIRVKPINYEVALAAMLPDYVERVYGRTPMNRQPDGALGYYVHPFDVNCEMTNNYYGITASKAAPQLVNYTLPAIGCGYGIIQRGTNYYLRKLP